MLTPLGATTRAGCPITSAVPGIGVGVKVAVGSGVGVSVSIGSNGVASTTDPLDAPAACCAVVSTAAGKVGVGVGRGAKLPQASVGPSQMSEAASSARNLQRWLNVRRSSVVDASSLFMAVDYILCTGVQLSCLPEDRLIFFIK